MSKARICRHNRQLSICAICAPAAEADLDRAVGLDVAVLRAETLELLSVRRRARPRPSETYLRGVVKALDELVKRRIEGGG